jgi:hypothetical protein
MCSYLIAITATVFGRDYGHDTCAKVLWVAVVFRQLGAAGANGVMAYAASCRPLR